MPKDPERSRLEEVRREADKQLEWATGMNQERFQQLDRIIGQGMRERLVEFDTRNAPPGTYGTLRYVVEEHGRKVILESPIVDDAVAAALIGLQHAARRPR